MADKTTNLKIKSVETRGIKENGELRKTWVLLSDPCLSQVSTRRREIVRKVDTYLKL